MTDRFETIAERPDHDRVVCHVDMDCFYAACERLREPALRGEPVVVGMGYESGEAHGAVATASYEAREFGVESAMAIDEALERLPRKVEAAEDPTLDVDAAGFYRPVDLEYYRDVAADVKAILHDHADVVREVSIDEAYLDVTDRVRWDGASGDAAGDETGDPGGPGGADARADPPEGGVPVDPDSPAEADRPTVTAFASDLKETIRGAVGVAASVGVAPTMSAAKIASDYDKPDGLVVVEPGEVREFLADLPVEEIHNVGPVTARELRDMGIETAGDLAAADPDELRDTFGERGLEVRRYARGEDDREVEPVGDPKSLSRESSFADATSDPEAKRERVRDLAVDVAERAEREGALYRTIGIKVVTPPYDVNTRAESLPGPVQDADLVVGTALDLLGEFEEDPARKLGVRVSNLTFAAGEQASLTGFDGGSTDETSTGADLDGDSARASTAHDGDAADVRGDDDQTADGRVATEGADDAEFGVEDPGDPDAVSSLPAGQTTLRDFLPGRRRPRHGDRE